MCRNVPKPRGPSLRRESACGVGGGGGGGGLHRLSTDGALFVVQPRRPTDDAALTSSLTNLAHSGVNLLTSVSHPEPPLSQGFRSQVEFLFFFFFQFSLFHLQSLVV